MASKAEVYLARARRLHAACSVATSASLVCVPWRSMENRIDAWDALAMRASEPNPFFESWYVLPSLRALDPDDTVQMLMLTVDGELAGLMPIARENRYYRWRCPHLCNWVHPNCFLGTPLVAAGYERAFWRALLTWCDANAGTALFLHLGHILLDGPLHFALETLVEEDRPVALVHREERAMLASGLTPEAYLAAALSSKERSELRRKLARLSEQGSVAFTRHAGSEDLDGWIEDFLALEASGWKGRAGSALVSRPETTALFREAVQGAAAHGKLERQALTVDGQPIAMLTSFLAPPGAFGYKSAFDESYARFSPGVLLLRENLAILERKDIHWFDSCAKSDHSMLDHLWRERRSVGRISIGLGGRMRRTAFAHLLRAELSRKPAGVGA